MADIFAAENIQSNDINAAAPAVSAVNQNGERTSTPDGKINDSAVASQLGDKINAMPQGQAADTPPALPSSDGTDMAQAMPQEPEAQPVNVPAEPPAAPSTKDIFAQEGIEPPTISDQNNNAINAGVNITDPQTPQAQAAKEYVQHQQSQDQVLAQSLFTPEELASFKNNPITFGTVGKFLDYKKVLPAGGLPALADDLQLLNIADKMKAGENVTPEDRQLVVDRARLQLEQNLRGFSLGGNLAYIGAQIPAFVTEFMMTGGVGKMAEVAAVKGAEGLAMKGIGSALVGGIAETAARTTVMVPQYTAKFGEMRLNDSMAVTDKGELLARQSTESPAMSALKAFAYTGAEVAGQVAAPAIGSYIIDPVTKAVSTPLVSAVNQLSPEIRSGMYEAFKKMQPNAQVSKVFTSMGWNGMLEQLGADRVSQVLHATTNIATDKNYNWHDYLNEITPSADQLLVEGGLVAIGGGIHAATSIAAHLMEAKGIEPAKAADIVQNMSANEKEQYVNENLPMPKSAYPEVKEGTVNASMTQGAVASMTRNQIRSRQAVDPPVVQDAQSGFNAAWESVKTFWNDKIYPEVWNDIHPIQELSGKAREAGAEVPVGEDTLYLSRMARQAAEFIRYNIQVATAHFNEDGNMVDTGKSLKSILDDYDNMFLTTEPDMDARHEDFNKYEQSQRFIHEAEKGQAYVSYAQMDQAVKHLQYVRDKYGANSGFFETFAQERRLWRNRILYNLVQSGLKSQEWYDDTIKANPFYTPLNRVVEEEGYAPAVTTKGIGKDPNANKIGSMKQFKGSDLEIKNTTESDIKNAALIIQKSATNRLLNSIAKFSSFYPEDVKVTVPRIIAKEVKVTYDPKLRAKLEAAVEFFGHTIERSAELKMKDTGKNVLGYHSEMDKLIALKLGTGEGVLTHEVGHMLDAKLGLGKKMLKDPVMKSELQKLAEDRLGGTATLEGEDAKHFKEQMEKTGTSKYMEYIKNDHEVIANFYDAYVNSPEQLDKVAPNAKAEFDRLLDADPKLSFIKDIKPSTSYAEEVIQKVVRDLDGKAGSFPFYENGSRKFLEMNDVLRKALKGLAPEEIGVVEKFLGAPFRAAKKGLQFGATAMPSFIIRHFERNLTMAWLNSEGKATPNDVAKGIFDVLGRSDDYKRWAATSGKFETFMPLDDKSLNKAYVDMFKEGSTSSNFNPMKWHKKMKEFADQPARVATFNALKKEGMSDMEAAFASLDNMVDFNQGGSFTKKIGHYAPFFKTIMNHGDVFVRAFKKDPAAYTLRAMATITIPQMVLTGYYLFGADDKTRNEYLEIPQWRKSLFTNIKIGDFWVPYPRAFAPGYIFGSLPEQIMLHMYGKYGGYAPEAKNSWLQMIAGAANTVSPVFDWSNALNPLIKSVFENITNYSFFLNRPVYNPDMKRLSPSQRSNTFTSETAKVMGDIFNFSPAMIDETVNNMAGNLGKFAMQLGDKGIKAVRGMEGKPVAEHPSDLADSPVYGGLFERNPMGSSSESAQEFYNHFEQVSQKNANLKTLDGKDLEKFQSENRADLSQYTMLSSAHKEIGGLQKQAKAVYQDTNMPADQKEPILKKLNEQITEIAKQANISYNRATGER